jgi:glutamyl-tRNA reductase
MHLVVVGVSAHTHDLQFRERVSQAVERCVKFLENAVVLSTCNRTEIYFVENNSGEDLAALFDQIKKISNLDLQPHSYVLQDSLAFLHLARVSAGLESLLFGETDIQRQVKESYEYAVKHNKTLPSLLHFVFQKSLKIAKSARTEYPS